MSGTLDDQTLRRALQSACNRWPFLRHPRLRDAYLHRLLLAPPELTEYLFDDEEKYEAALEKNRTIASELLVWSHEFPMAIFAHIEAECFGGACIYSGFACRDRVMLEVVAVTDDAHVRLLHHVGLITEGPFEPFQRGFFEGRSSGLRS